MEIMRGRMRIKEVKVSNKLVRDCSLVIGEPDAKKGPLKTLTCLKGALTVVRIPPGEVGHASSLLSDI